MSERRASPAGASPSVAADSFDCATLIRHVNRQAWGISSLYTLDISLAN